MDSLLDLFNLLQALAPILVLQFFLHFLGEHLSELLLPLSVLLVPQLHVVGAVSVPKSVDVVIQKLVHQLEAHQKATLGLQVALLCQELGLEN